MSLMITRGGLFEQQVDAIVRPWSRNVIPWLSLGLRNAPTLTAAVPPERSAVQC
jgi:hypothetical protein